MKVQREALDTIKEIQDDYGSKSLEHCLINSWYTDWSHFLIQLFLGVISQEVIQRWLEDEKKTLTKKDAPKGKYIESIYFLLNFFYADQFKLQQS